MMLLTAYQSAENAPLHVKVRFSVALSMEYHPLAHGHWRSASFQGRSLV